MSSQLKSLSELTNSLAATFPLDHYPAGEQGGIYKPSNRLVARLGLVLDPWSGLSQWLTEAEIDALWIHRPWGIDLTTLPTDIGVIYHHLPFDETMTIGYNPSLAGLMDAVSPLESIGYKQASGETGIMLPKRPVGMLFDIPEQEFDGVLNQISRMFIGYERAEAGRCPTGYYGIRRVAVVGAMTDTLVREAHERGVDLYITGQYRKIAQKAVDESGMAVIAVGHRRSEEWGLHRLAMVINEQFPQIHTFIPTHEQNAYVVGA